MITDSVQSAAKQITPSQNLNLQNTSPISNTSGGLIQGLKKLLFGQTVLEKTMTAITNDKGHTVLKTEDGYQVTFPGTQESFLITGPNGKTTKIWGDPHVTESDGDQWDFKSQSSFLFGNNKITVETTTKPGYGLTFSKTVTVYNGQMHFSLTGIDENKPELVAYNFEGGAHDASLDDGDIYQLSFKGSDEIWQKVEN